MATIVKRKLSGAPTGNTAVLVAATGTTGTTVHTAVAGTTAGTFDEIWLWAYNGHTAAVTLTVEFGGVTVPNQNIIATIAAKSGLIPIVPGLILQNGLVVSAFAGTINVITLSGFVNNITD
jgi:hypothetical protein